jgi:hypothetical protein
VSVSVVLVVSHFCLLASATSCQRSGFIRGDGVVWWFVTCIPFQFMFVDRREHKSKVWAVAWRQTMCIVVWNFSASSQHGIWFHLF